jgi:hypothetical protein
MKNRATARRAGTTFLARIESLEGPHRASCRLCLTWAVGSVRGPDTVGYVSVDAPSSFR